MLVLPENKNYNFYNFCFLYQLLFSGHAVLPMNKNFNFYNFCSLYHLLFSGHAVLPMNKNYKNYYFCSCTNIPKNNMSGLLFCEIKESILTNQKCIFLNSSIFYVSAMPCTNFELSIKAKQLVQIQGGLLATAVSEFQIIF